MRFRMNSRPDLEGRRSSRAVLYETANLPFYCQRIVAGAEHLGWVIVFGPQTPSGAVQLALGEICVTIALHRMKELAAARALSDKLSSLCGT